MARGGVAKVDRKLGTAVIVWEGIDCIFMAKVTGGVQLVGKVYPFKDRLYPDRRVRVPKDFFHDMCRQAGAIFASRRHKENRLQKLSQELKKAQVVVSPTKREEQQQLMLF